MSNWEQGQLGRATDQLRELRQGAEQLRSWGQSQAMPAVEYNAARLLAVIAMLELNLGDLRALEEGGSDAEEHTG